MDIDDRYISWFKDQSLIKFYSGTIREYNREYFIKELETGEETGSHYIYGIFTIKQNLLIGNIKIGPIIKAHKVTDVNIIIGDKNFHGKGIAQEAFKIGNYLTFEVHDIRKISSGMYAANRSSFKALKKSGWVIEGRRKGHYLVDGKPMDQILVSCFNPNYFPIEEIKKDFPDNDYM